MNILSQLPSLDGTEVEEVDAEQEKQDRIAFHRTHVRNGPVNFKGVSSGQVRRARAREVQGRLKKARRGQVRTYFAQEREIATLRGLLQAVGVLPYVAHHKPTEEQVWRSVRALVQKHGNLLLEGDELVRDALQSAYDRFTSLTGAPQSKLEYGA